MSTPEVRAEAERLLQHEIDAIGSQPYAAVLDRFTEMRRTLLTRRLTRSSRAEEIREVYGPTGRGYDVEAWAVEEYECQLHIFVTLFGQSDTEVFEVGTSFLMYPDGRVDR